MPLQKKQHSWITVTLQHAKHIPQNTQQNYHLFEALSQRKLSSASWLNDDKLTMPFSQNGRGENKCGDQKNMKSFGPEEKSSKNTLFI